MPQGDRTGPNGAGPMTGRAMGFCAGNNSPGFMNSGRGRGMGRGRGFAWRTQPQAISRENTSKKPLGVVDQEKEMLEQELKAIEQEQEEIKARLKKL